MLSSFFVMNSRRWRFEHHYGALIVMCSSIVIVDFLPYGNNRLSPPSVPLFLLSDDFVWLAENDHDGAHFK